MASKTPEMLPADRAAIQQSLTLIRRIENDLEKAKMHSRIVCLQAMTNLGVSSEHFSVGQLPNGDVGFIRKGDKPAAPAKKLKAVPATAPAPAPAATATPAAPPVEGKRGRGRPRKTATPPAPEAPAPAVAAVPAVAPAPEAPAPEAPAALAATASASNEALVNDLLGDSNPA